MHYVLYLLDFHVKIKLMQEFDVFDKTNDCYCTIHSYTSYFKEVLCKKSKLFQIVVRDLLHEVLFFYFNFLKLRGCF